MTMLLMHIFVRTFIYYVILDAQIMDHGAFETKTVADVQQEPYSLPNGFEWCECEMSDEKTV